MSMLNLKFSQKVSLFSLYSKENSYIDDKILLGNRYSVFNAVMLVPGVHNGSSGPMLFTNDVIESNVNGWDGRPVLNDHPQGNYSGASPIILNKTFLGNVFNTYTSDGSLNAEIWLSKEYAKNIISLIFSGENIDVSVGIWADVDFENGIYNGEKYSGIITKFIPDHLAVLLNKEGACSWKDGCGIRKIANIGDEKGDEMDNEINLIRERARIPSYDGMETTSWADVDKTLTAFVSGYYKNNDVEVPDEPPRRIGDLSATVKRWIASKTLLGDVEANNVRDLIFFPVVNPSSNKLNAGALRAVLGGRGVRADIPEETKTSAQRVARRLLEKFKVEEESIFMDTKIMVEEVNEKNGQVEKIEQKAEVKKDIGLEEVMSILDDDLKRVLSEGLQLREDKRAEAIEIIKEVENINFCDEFLKNMDYDNLSELAKLANFVLNKKEDLVDQDKKNVEQKVDNNVIDYSLKIPNSKKSSDWAPMPKINWNK